MSESAENSAHQTIHPDPARWWRHRRRHSYLSLAGLFALPFTASVLDPQRLAVTVPLLQTLAWVFCAVVITYVVSATGEDVSRILGDKK